MSGETAKLNTQQAIRLIRLLSAILIAKVTFSVVANNANYFPPDFQSEFLIGRRHYFYGFYQYAFYAHVISGPISLLLGVILVSTEFRQRWRVAHRRIGKIQIVNVVLMVAPSGLVMAWRAIGGVVSVSGFAVLALLTAGTATMGYVTARQRQFESHGRWMFRCFLLLVSAVVLRLVAGISVVTESGGDWLYPASAWLSWLGPLALYEAAWRLRRETVR